MIKRIPFPEEDLLGFEIKGKVSEPAFVQLMQELIPNLDSPGNFKLYIEIPRYEGTEWRVIWDTLKWATQQLGDYFKKVDKLAVVTDKAWMRNVASAEYFLIPSIEEKSFEFSEKEKALEWIKK